MALLYAYKPPGFLYPTGLPSECMYSLAINPAFPLLGHGTRITVPRACFAIGAEFVVAWQGAAPGFIGTLDLVVNGIVVLTLPMSGVSGILVPPPFTPNIPLLAGDTVTFQHTQSSAGGAALAWQGAIVIRAAIGQATRGRFKLSFAPPPGYPFVVTGAPNFNEAVDAAWNAATFFPNLNTGILIPKGGTVLAEVRADVGGPNTLDQPSTLLVHNVLVPAPVPGSVFAYAPAGTGQQSAIAGTVLPLGTVLSGQVSTNVGAAGSMLGPVRYTGILNIP